MKRTTYILIGFLASICLLTVGFLLLCIQDPLHGSFERSCRLCHSRTELAVPPCRVVRLSADRSVWVETEEYRLEILPNLYELPLTLHRASAGASGTLRCDSLLARSVTMQHRGDTLDIHFDFQPVITYFARRKELAALHRLQGGQRLLCLSDAEGIHLSLPPSATTLIHRQIHHPVILDGVEGDSLILYNRNSIRVDSCRLHALRIEGGNPLEVKRGTIGHLFLNLNQTRAWTVCADSTDIGTEHLTGKGHFWNTLQRGECRHVLWTPLDADSKLEIRLDEASSISIN